MLNRYHQSAAIAQTADAMAALAEYHANLEEGPVSNAWLSNQLPVQYYGN